MDAETWLTGKAAVEKGFADGLLSSDQVIENPDAREQARVVNSVRQFESYLVHEQHMPRSAARALISELKDGKPGAAGERSGKPGAAAIVKPGADATNWIAGAKALSQSI
jgi:hypothetical protein